MFAMVNDVIVIFIAVTQHHSKKYEGRPINKLQNGIILLIFKI